MAETRKYNLEELEAEYYKLTAKGDTSAAQRMRTILSSIRYDLANESEVQMEYRTGMETPMLMRILRTEKDLDRWVEQRFIRLSEFDGK